jgi:hypothetical protein
MINAGGAEQIANAVLYEGYILYPYRASAIKNRKRFNFGVVYPRSYSDAQGGLDPWSIQTECLITGGAGARVNVKVRFLQLVSRLVGGFEPPLPEMPEHPGDRLRLVEALEIDGAVYSAWQEAVEREIELEDCDLAAMTRSLRIAEINLNAGEACEPLPDAAGRVAGAFLRRRNFILGSIEVGACPAAEGSFRLQVRVLNLTPFESGAREAAMEQSLISAHVILTVRGGQFVSLLDPGDALRDAAAQCRNVGTFPVLAGEPGSYDLMLSSPIILYDYPQVAPESAGSFFDGTEIDEMLALRVMTLTDEEKREMRQVDQHARELLDRTESLPPEHLLKLHGVLRGLRPVREEMP